MVALLRRSFLCRSLPQLRLAPFANGASDAPASLPVLLTQYFDAPSSNGSLVSNITLMSLWDAANVFTVRNPV